VAKIIPLKGIYFKLKNTADIKKLTCPPYDVITPKEQKRFYLLHSNNIIRLVLGKKYKSDTKIRNRNTRAAYYFQTWLDKGILKKQDEPLIYVYGQKYRYQKKLYTPLGFVALSHLEDWRRKRVLPHEDIFDKFKTDRLNLLRATKANFESILALYPHSARIEKVLKKVVKKTSPLLKVIDEQKVEHSIYLLRNRKEISIIQEEMKKRPLFIADGHHRYQAALSFSKEMARSKLSARYKTSNYRMMTFMDMDKGNLTILPTHRLVYNIPNFSCRQLFDNLAPHFRVKKVSARNFQKQLKERGKKHAAFGLYLKGDRYFIIELKPEAKVEKIIKEKKSTAWKKLDVTILQKLVLNKLFSDHPGNHLYYTRDFKEALSKVRSSQAKLAFLLNPTKIEDVRLVASRGERMPQKSTYFFPKLRSGLIMRKMDD